MILACNPGARTRRDRSACALRCRLRCGFDKLPALRSGGAHHRCRTQQARSHIRPGCAIGLHGPPSASTGTGKGCPLLPGSSSPHPTACGPTPSHPRGWAPRRFRSLRSLHKGGARVGAWRRPLSSPPPKAAAGRAPAVAQPARLSKAAAGFAGGCASLAKPGGLCRSPRRCSVAAGPRRVVGQRLPSAYATHPGTLRPSGWLA